MVLDRLRQRSEQIQKDARAETERAYAGDRRPTYFAGNPRNLYEQIFEPKERDEKEELQTLDQLK